MAAYEMAVGGFDVLLLEKHRRPGTPLACAEAVSRLSFEELTEARPDWINATIEKAVLIGPTGEKVTVFRRKAGYILDRKKFDFDLAQRAKAAGCFLECETIALGLRKAGRLFDAVEILKSSGEKRWVRASIFIAADGVESRIARLAGMDNQLNFDEIQSLLQYRLEDITVPTDTIEFYIGREISPGGYLWVFPKSACSANVGLGITTDSNRGQQLERLLNAFIKRRFERSRVVEKICGVVPKYMGRKMFRRDNLLVVGDAARAIDSLSGAGVIYAMTSGKYAGQAAVEYLSGRIRNVKQIEKCYPGRFLDEKEDELLLYARLKDLFNNLSDGDFTDVVKALKDYFADRTADGIRAAQLVAAIVKARPRLLRLARHLI
jgi:digeranylgeranylglycerophospholipid reductase